MSEPGITPLAQRLAEENNVDWRALTGSGDGGRIVERDVLEYLAKVMAGEEALDPTPEPLPEGMTAWPEADGWAGDRLGAAQQPDWNAAAADDDSDALDWPEGDDATDFGTPVAFDAEQAELRASGEWPAATGSQAESDSGFAAAEDPLDSADDFDLSEDIFLFDDDGDLTDSEPVAEQSGSDEPAAASPAELSGFGLLDDGLSAEVDEPLFLDEDAAAGGDAPEPALHLDDDEEDLLSDIGLLEVEPEELQAGAGTDLLGDEQFEDADLDDLASLDGELDDPELAGDALQEFETGFTMESLEQQAPVTAEPAAGTYAFEQGEDRFEQEQELAGAETLDSDSFDIEFPDTATADSWQDGVELAAELDAAADPDEADALARRIEAAFESVADSRPEFEEFGEELDDVTPAASLNLADFGKLLRRQLDVSDLNRAQELVGSEISGAAEVASGAFLLRAASRAAAGTSFAAEAPAVALIVDDRIELVRGAGTGFRDLAQKLRGVAGGELTGDAALASVDLAVADMSSLEVDEAVLDLGVPVLSLGRSVRDEDSGALRSTLTLSGHFDLQEGARFLQAVSELLASPLRLLL